MKSRPSSLSVFPVTTSERRVCVCVSVCLWHSHKRPIVRHTIVCQPRPVQQSLSRPTVARASISRVDRRLRWTLTDLSPISSPRWSPAQRELPGLCHLFQWSHSPRWGPGRGQKARGPAAWKEISISQIGTQCRASAIVFKHSNGVCLFVYLAASMAIRTIRTPSFSQRECKWEKLFLSLFCVLFCFLCLGVACKSRNVKYACWVGVHLPQKSLNNQMFCYGEFFMKRVYDYSYLWSGPVEIAIGNERLEMTDLCLFFTAKPLKTQWNCWMSAAFNARLFMSLI